MRVFGQRSVLGRRRTRGQAMVEFAFTAPIFFVLLIGLVEGGRFVFYSEALNHAAREGARYAIIHGANSNPASLRTGPAVVPSETSDPTGEFVKQAVRDAAVGFGEPDAIVVPDPVYVPDNNRRPSNVTVRVSYTYTPVVPVFGPITIDAEATLVVNN